MSIIAKPIPTDNPSGSFIGYKNLLTASTTPDAEKAITPNTYERFEPSSGSLTVKFQMSEANDVDFIGIAAHNLSGETLLISTAETVGGALTSVESISPNDNSAIMLIFDTRNIQEVIITGTLISASEIGVISAGKALQMPRNIYGGHSPINLSKVTEFRSAKSESGQILGKDIIRKGLKTEYRWRLLDDEFLRGEFKSFSDSAITTPFFIKWRPDFYSDEVAYGEVNHDIVPTNSGGGIRLMDVGFILEAHAE